MYKRLAKKKVRIHCMSYIQSCIFIWQSCILTTYSDWKMLPHFSVTQGQNYKWDSLSCHVKQWNLSLYTVVLKLSNIFIEKCKVFVTLNSVQHHSTSLKVKKRKQENVIEVYEDSVCILWSDNWVTLSSFLCALLNNMKHRAVYLRQLSFLASLLRL